MGIRILPRIGAFLLAALVGVGVSGCGVSDTSAASSSARPSSDAARSSSAKASSFLSAGWSGLTAAQEDANASAADYAGYTVGSLGGIPVICYHDLMLPAAKGNVNNRLVMTTDRFDREMAILKGAGYSAVGMENLRQYIQNGGDASRKVVITFDDGYKQSCLLAAPILRKYGFRATMFVIASYLDQPDQACGYDHFSIQYISKKDMAQTSDVFTFASHTYHMHIDLRTQRSPTALRQDLTRSRSVLGGTVYFAYPAGDFDASVEQQLRQAGFTMAFTTKRKYVRPGISLYEIPRFELYSDFSDRAFESILGISKS